MNALFFIIPMVIFGILACVFSHLYHKEKEEKEAIAQCLAEWKDRIVTLIDKAPANGKRELDNVLALSDKLKKYVVKDGGIVKITVVKE